MLGLDLHRQPTWKGALVSTELNREIIKLQKLMKNASEMGLRNQFELTQRLHIDHRQAQDYLGAAEAIFLEQIGTRDVRDAFQRLGNKVYCIGSRKILLRSSKCPASAKNI